MPKQFASRSCEPPRRWPALTHSSAVGRADDAAADALHLIEADPFRESVWDRRMRALHASGRTVDALRVFQDYRRMLAEELGLEPSPELVALERALLTPQSPKQRPDTTLGADVVRHLTGSHSTHRHVRRPPLELKGFPDPVDACEVASGEEVASAWLPRRLAEAVRSSCVGRERELETLRDAWASVKAGRRRLALVSGEPGIGKTRLVAELASSAGDSTIAYGWCDHDTSAAFFPWLSVVRSLARSHPDVLADAVAPTLATELHRLVPELGPGVVPAAGDASLTRMYLLDAIDTFLGGVSARQPVLVVLDDLHWADGSTLAVIRHLLRSDRDEPLLIVGTYRDTEVDRTDLLARNLHDLQREPGSVRVMLSGLRRDSVGVLIADRAGHAASDEFVDLIYDETEGNPYFTEEVLAHLAETGAVVKNVHGEWVNTVPLSDVGVPEGIRDTLGRRLSRLPVETNEVLSVAAVVGREFDVVVVGDVLSLARLDVIERLEPALDARLVHLGTASSVGSFAHALVRESLLDEMRSTRRTRLHWLVGHAFASRPGIAPAVVAHHLCEGALAGDVGEAAAAAIGAATAADQLGASEDVFAWSARAIEVLGDDADQYPELHNLALYNRGSAGVFYQPGDAGPSSDLVAATSLALDRHDYVLALRAIALALRAFPPPAALDKLAARTVDEAPEGTAYAAVARGLRALLAAYRGQPFDLAEAEAAVEALDAAIPLDLSWYARDGFVELLLGLPDLDRCRDVLLSTVTLGERHKSPLVVGMATIGLAWLGARAADRRTVETVVQRVRATLRGGGWDSVLGVDISLALADGRLDEAEVLIHDASALAIPNSGPAWMFEFQAELLAHLRGASNGSAPIPPSPLTDLPWEVARRSARNGDWVTANSSLESLIPHSVNELRKPLPIMHVLVSVAEAAGLVRDVERAAMLIPELIPYSGQMAIGPALCELKCPVSSVLGRLRALTGDLDGGIADCEAGLSLVNTMRTPLLGAESSIVLADVLALRGNNADVVRARALVDEAIDVSESCGALGVADMGRRLLANTPPR